MFTNSRALRFHGRLDVVLWLGIRSLHFLWFDCRLYPRVASSMWSYLSEKVSFSLLCAFSNEISCWPQTRGLVEVYREGVRDFAESLSTDAATVLNRSVDSEDRANKALESKAAGLSEGSSCAPCVPVDEFTQAGAEARRVEGVVALQGDSRTFLVPEEEVEREIFLQWANDEYSLTEHRAAIGRLMESVRIRGLHDQLVPNRVSDFYFWARYFYCLDQVNRKEDERGTILSRVAQISSQAQDESEDWDGENGARGGKAGDVMRNGESCEHAGSTDLVVKRDQDVEGSGVKKDSEGEDRSDEGGGKRENADLGSSGFEWEMVGGQRTGSAASPGKDVPNKEPDVAGGDFSVPRAVPVVAHPERDDDETTTVTPVEECAEDSKADGGWDDWE